MKLFTRPPLPVLQHVAPPWRTLVLVCANCKGARRGPDPKDLRKQLKKQLGKGEVRVTEVDCLKVCPDDAVTVCVVRSEASPELCLVASDDDREALTARLRNG